jgi:uncharacterized protein (TIGR02996 family)
MDNPKLLAAIIAHPDDDAPRLAYANWLQAHGDTDRAEFIRVQCRLAALTPDHPDYVDLVVRQGELAACLRPRFQELTPEEPERFYVGQDFLDDDEEPFRRGFPYFIDCQMQHPEWTPKGTAEFAAALERLVRTTTVRGLHLYEIPPARMADLLAIPAVAELSGLALSLAGGSKAGVKENAAYRLFANSPAVRRARHLGLYDWIDPSGIAALAKAKALGAVRRLTILGITAAPAGLTRLLQADWFRRLCHLRIICGAEVETILAAALGELPKLHTLELPSFGGAAVPALAAGRFPSLARLVFGGPLDRPSAAVLAGARFPRLAAFTAAGHRMKNDGLQELLRAEWFARLRILDLSFHGIGDKGVSAFAAHPVTRTLRVLRLGQIPFGKTGLAALAQPGAFPELNTLDLGCYLKSKASEADLVSFLSALDMPRLRHLVLHGWPVGNAGAKVLARSAAFAGLRRLDLSQCSIGDAGAKALFASPHLQNLVELRLDNNSIKAGANALADPTVMPHLGECWLSLNNIPKASAAKIEGTGRWVIL